MDRVPTPDGDAIIALGTPPGIGLRAMLRLSGAGIIDALAPAFTPEPGPEPRFHLKTRIGIGAAPHGVGVPCLVLGARAPHSFTGEDVLEIQLPANRTVLARAEARLREFAASRGRTLRPAGAGEFTARAYLAGRLDAAAVTGVALAIAAEDRRGVDAANRWREKGEATDIAAAATGLTSAIARLEAGIDFTDEEDVVGCSAGELRGHLEAVLTPLRSIRRHVNAVAGAESDRYRVVLTGPPNAGKSSLFNALIGSVRTVAHDQAGTTRDAIEADIEIEDGFGRIGVTLVDTAGVGASADPLAELATNASEKARRSADLEIWCVPADAISDDSFPLADDPGNGILLVTKDDLLADDPGIPGTRRCSAATGSGIAELRRAIVDHAEERTRLGPVSARLLDAIHRDLDAGIDRIEEALRMLGDVSEGSAPQQPEIVVSIVSDALDAVGRRFGGHDPDAVLDLIFGSFCIGK